MTCDLYVAHVEVRMPISWTVLLGCAPIHCVNLEAYNSLCYEDPKQVTTRPLHG